MLEADEDLAFGGLAVGKADYVLREGGAEKSKGFTSGGKGEGADEVDAAGKGRGRHWERREV